MGLYLPGIEIPTSCIVCHLNFGEKRPKYGLTICCPYSDGVISWRDKAFDNGRLSSCGIVPVPEHGRLMDKDAFIDGCKALSSNDPHDIAGMEIIKFFMEEIVPTPTIIPADPPVMYYPQVPGITPTVISDKEGEG